MFNVCYACGLYRADKIVEQSEQPGYADAICPVCGHRHRFRQLPLLIVTGASGAGKSTICQQLAGEIDYAVMLDVDILWRPEFDRPETSYRDFFETWLRMAKNIAQAGRPVVLVGAGVGVPENLAPCVERRYVGAIHYLALVCADDVLATRLHSRPAWRQSSSDEYIEALVDSVTQGFGGNVGVVPRQFLRKFVNAMDIVRDEDEYDPLTVLREGGYVPSLQDLSDEEKAKIPGAAPSPLAADNDEFVPVEDSW